MFDDELDSAFDIRKNIFAETATKKNDKSDVTKEPQQGHCRNVLQKKIYILKKYILQKHAAYNSW